MHVTRVQGQTVGRAVDLSATKCYKTSKTAYTPLVPILRLLPSTAAEAGRMGFVVKAKSTRAKAARVFLTVPRYPLASYRPCRPDSPEPTSASGHTPFGAMSMSRIAWHSYLSISEKEILLI